MDVGSLLIKNGFWGISGFNFFDNFAHVGLMLNTGGTQNKALRALSLGDMVLVWKERVAGNALGDAWTHLATKGGKIWMGEAGEGKKIKPERGKENWQDFGGEYQVYSPDFINWANV